MIFRATGLICMSLALLFSSCTVEKRRHLNGYYVSWNGSVKRDHSKKAEKTEVKESQFSGKKTTHNMRPDDANNGLVSGKKREEFLMANKSPDNLTDNNLSNDEPIENLNTSHAFKKGEEKKWKRDKGDSQLHPNTVMGIFSAALSIPAVIAMIAAFSGGYFSVILGILLFLIWLFLVAFGFIFGITAFTNTLDHPDEYKGPVWAALGIALSVASVILFFFLMGLL